MGKLRDLQNNVRGLSEANKLVALTLEVIYELENYIVLQNKAQLFSGKRADGSALPLYAASSKKTGKVKLYDQGYFYNGFHIVRTGSFDVTISSEDFKTPFLVKIYGKDIFGLSKDALGKFSKDKLLPILRDKIKNALHL